MIVGNICTNNTIGIALNHSFDTSLVSNRILDNEVDMQIIPEPSTSQPDSNDMGSSFRAKLVLTAGICFVILMNVGGHHRERKLQERLRVADEARRKARQARRAEAYQAVLKDHDRWRP